MDFKTTLASLPVNGWLSEAEAQLLWKCCEETSGNILEVGCYHGRSTCLLAAHGRTVYSVDPFSKFDSDDMEGVKTRAAFCDNIAKRSIRNVELFHMRIEDWEPRPVGLAYLDGDHTHNGTLAQINVALACRPRIIAIHDVNDYGEGQEVKRAAQRLLGPWYDRVERLAIWLR